MKKTPKEALDFIENNISNGRMFFEEEFEILEEALNRLETMEAIDNANPSEALECLEKIIDNLDDYADFEIKQEANEYTTTIKQALLKAQELENTFADSHICEIQKEFAKYDKLCEETKCEECALGVGDGICLRKTFERKWELQKEVVSPNSVNLLMRELDCKDFADLRKYARCGYDRLNSNKFKDSKEIKIEIPESSLMDYNPIKQYLKWEDLEFKKETQEMHILLNGNLYFISFGLLFGKTQQVELYSKNEEHLMNFNSYYKEDKQFFNDLHLEVLE